MQVQLLGRFQLRIDGRLVELRQSGGEFVAALALHDGSLARSRLSQLLWPDSPEDRQRGNLRSLLYRAPDALARRVAVNRKRIEFVGPCRVDLQAARRCAEAALRSSDASPPMSLLCEDILPAMDAFWLVVHRERHRQFRLHALEALAARRLREGRPLDALDLAMAALASEPLRESAQLLVLRSHLEAGNRAAVVRCYQSFEERLDAVLGVQPSHAMRALRAAASRDAAVTSH